MKIVTKYLDRIASSLENRGLIKEAEAIDKISDTIDKFAYKSENDPAYINMGRAISALEANKNSQAKSFLTQIKGNMDMKNRSYGTRSNDMKQAYETYNQAVSSLFKGVENPQIISMLQTSMQYLKKAEPFINEAQMRPMV